MWKLRSDIKVLCLYYLLNESQSLFSPLLGLGPKVRACLFIYMTESRVTIFIGVDDRKVKEGFINSQIYWTFGSETEIFNRYRS